MVSSNIARTGAEDGDGGSGPSGLGGDDLAVMYSHTYTRVN